MANQMDQDKAYAEEGSPVLDASDSRRHLSNPQEESYEDEEIEVAHPNRAQSMKVKREGEGSSLEGSSAMGQMMQSSVQQKLRKSNPTRGYERKQRKGSGNSLISHVDGKR